MASINQEQLEKLKQKAFPIFEYLQRKEALELVRQLEKLGPSLAPTDPEILKEYQKLIAQLKWVACPLIQNDQEFFGLIKNHFLEGLELDVDLADLAGDKIALQFGYNFRETLSNIVSALRANEQEIGSNSIIIQGETLPVRPSIKNWLLDFIRSTPSQYPTSMDESNYLFANANAKNLSEKEKIILGKVLDFCDSFKAVVDQWAMEEREGQIVSLPETSPAESTTTIPSVPAAPPPARPTPPPQKPPTISQPTSPQFKPDTYKEPVSHEDITGPPGARKVVEPRINGNIVDLSDRSHTDEKQI